jgi:hypothetical protein
LLLPSCWHARCGGGNKLGFLGGGAAALAAVCGELELCGVRARAGGEMEAGGAGGSGMVFVGPTLPHGVYP